MIGDIRQTGIMAGGFCIGASLAVAIAPGDIFLWIATGIVLGLFSHFFFEEKSGRAAHWPFVGSSRTHTVRIHRSARGGMFRRHPRQPTDHAETGK
jgi:hypothetical protein